MNKPEPVGFWPIFTLFALAFALSYWQHAILGGTYFDETHYVPAVRDWFHAKGDKLLEHPPLGRMILALSMQFLGDNEYAWRFPSMIAGAWSVATLGLIGFWFTLSMRGFWITGLLGLASGGIFVFSRIAMLDGIAASFMLMSLYYFIRSIHPDAWDPKSIHHAGFYLGLSLATKWSALPFWAIGVLFLSIQAFRVGTRYQSWNLFLHWILSPLFIYASVYAFWLYKTDTLTFQTWAHALSVLQVKIFQTMGVAATDHPYRSLWWEWPTMTRPTWFMFEPVDETHVRGVLFWINPVILVLGLVSLLSLLKSALQKRTMDRAFVPCAFLALWLVWAVTSRSAQFFYYYYPAALLLVIALGVVLAEIRTRWLSYLILGSTVGLFVFFYPILAGETILRSSLTKWMWLQSWI